MAKIINRVKTKAIQTNAEVRIAAPKLPQNSFVFLKKRMKARRNEIPATIKLSCVTKFFFINYFYNIKTF